MTREDLFEAIGNLSDEALISLDHSGSAAITDRSRVLVFPKKKETGHFSSHAKRWTAVAACFVVVVAGLFVWRTGLLQRKGATNSAEKVLQQEMSSTETTAEGGYVQRESSSAAMELITAEDEAVPEAEEAEDGYAVNGYMPLETMLTAIQNVAVQTGDEEVVFSKEEREAFVSTLQEAWKENGVYDYGLSTRNAADTQVTFMLELTEGEVLATLYEEGFLVVEGYEDSPIHLTQEQVKMILAFTETEE